MSELSLMLPMRSTHVGYVHGQRNAQNELHPGVDLNYGKPNEDDGRMIVTPIDVEIVHVDRKPYFGRTVVGVNHDLGYAFRYMHLAQVLVEKGDWLNPEEYLGRCGKDDGGNGRYHVGMTAHLHHDIMRLDALKKYGMNVMTWARAVKDRDVFDEVFVDPRDVYAPLRALMATPRCWEPKTVKGKYVEYLR